MCVRSTSVWDDELAWEEDLVRGKKTRNPDPPTRHSLQVILSLSPTLILIQHLSSISAVAFKAIFPVQNEKRTGEEKNLSNHVPECTSKQG